MAPQNTIKEKKRKKNNNYDFLYILGEVKLNYFSFLFREKRRGVTTKPSENFRRQFKTSGESSPKSSGLLFVFAFLIFFMLDY
ncbi:hypothetical protein PGB90_002349 [Kerria lacca]